MKEKIQCVCELCYVNCHARYTQSLLWYTFCWMQWQPAQQVQDKHFTPDVRRSWRFSIVHMLHCTKPACAQVEQVYGLTLYDAFSSLVNVTVVTSTDRCNLQKKWHDYVEIQICCHPETSSTRGWHAFEEHMAHCCVDN